MTLIERIAQSGYQIAYDEAALSEIGGRSGLARGQYQFLPCKYGEIYEFGAGVLAWYCTGPRVAERVKKEIEKRALDWPEVLVEADTETVFIFPITHFDEIANLAKPRRSRSASQKVRAHLSEVGQKTKIFTA